MPFMAVADIFILHVAPNLTFKLYLENTIDNDHKKRSSNHRLPDLMEMIYIIILL
jgi:hypothetical protein